ncbi:kelch domain-containing protein 10-like isoform X2 [Oratosquilla oratoria]|uniref:kelch domain-containing protein 10-like isoform X2 n=1 Tax=Oratosquilla oratoria TaxID=337810 RepID=UPI003F76B916
MKGTYKFKPFTFTSVKPRGNNRDGTPTPEARSGHRIVCYGPSFYSFGGYNPYISKEDYNDLTWQRTCPLFQELWQFNFLSCTWTRLLGSGEVPNELASHCALQVGPNLVVFGGTAMPFGSASSNLLHICHLPSVKWRKVTAKGDLPFPMYGQAVCVHKGSMFCIGGTTGTEYSIDIHRLDLRHMEWCPLIPRILNPYYLPEARYRHEIVEHRGNLYVFGGGRHIDAYDLVIIPTFNLAQSLWTQTQTQPDPVTKNHPVPRRCHVLVKVGNEVFIHGGYNGKQAFSDMWRLNLDTMEWRKLLYKTPVPLYFHSATVTEEGCMYIFGGVKNLEANERTARIFKVWLRVAKLRDICWEAMCFYNPHLPHKSPAALLQMGIPQQIVEQLDLPPACG